MVAILAQPFWRALTDSDTAIRAKLSPTDAWLRSITASGLASLLRVRFARPYAR